MFNLDLSVHALEVVTIDLHYMTDRPIWPKISKLKLLWKQRHLHQLKHTKNWKVNYPF